MEQPNKSNKKKFGRISTIILIVAVICLLVGVFMIIRENVLFSEPYEAPPTPVPASTDTPASTPTDAPASTPTSAPASTPTNAPSAKPEPTPEPTPYIKPVPTHIYFTDAKVSCEILPVGVNEQGEMATLNSATQAAWYQYGPAPGEDGNAILNGHVRWKHVKGTFSVLLDMKVGDQVAIEFADGDFKYFTVASVDTYHYTNIPDSVMSAGGEPRVTLITCLGDYNNDLGMSESRVIAVLHEN